MRVFYARSDERTDAYRLLAAALHECYGVPCPRIARDRFGKPYFPARPDIHFSISHTRGLVMAVLDGAPCGCDAEALRPVSRSVALRVTAPGELDSFTFMELWTLKESYFKLLGHTELPFSQLVFRRDGRDIVPPDPTVHARLYSLPGLQLAAVSRISPPEEIKCLQLRRE